MEVVGAACGLVPSLLSPLKEQINYVKNLKKNFTKLEEDVKALCNLKDDISKIARDTSKILSKECKGWTEKVHKVVTEVKEIKEEVDENRRCLNRCCFPDICARRKVGKRVKTMLEDVAELKKDADFKMGETAVERTVKRIMQSIRYAKIKKIGLWGMGGVGKTTALKNLNNHSEIAQTFEVVIWVTVSKEGSERKVQKDIAQRLQMGIQPSESDQSTARKLHEKLKTMKYLLLLDDLWSPVNLDDVGIPIQEGSKVVLTTRSFDVCRKMLTDEEIKVECLSEEEAWGLFREKAGGVVDSPSIEPIAKDVAKECAGLPLAAVVTGKSLRKVEDVHVWLDALNQLKSATFQFGDIEDGLFERLKLSYDRLKEVEQSCFLYCALYPEDDEILVVELVERWRLEGFTSRSGMDSLADADDRGHTIVNNLVDASLVERTVDCVKMHDVLRDLALRIASSKFLVRAGLGIEECPYDEKEWEKARRISLMENKLSGGLPTNPRCDELSTLLLNRNESLEYIPDMFFQHMPSLRVVDLNWTRIKVVPASVSNLVNLRGLYASCWGPVDLPHEIGALEKLEVLHVSVGSLPLEVRQLTSLRRLWVTFYEDTEEGMRTICSNGVISSLFQLEDLRIFFSGEGLRRKLNYKDLRIYFGGEDLRREWCKVVGDSRVAEEVGRLKRLTRLQFEVLPGSVSNLVNLRGLYVIGYNPVDLPREIGALEKLEVIHVSVGSLPLEVRQLTSLRRLWVQFRGVEAMRTICSNGVISSLSRLEDLRIYFEYHDKFDLRREWCKVVDDSRVGEEVGRLKRLTRLQFDFSTIECFEHFLLQQQRNKNSCSFPGFKDFHLSMTSGIHVPDVIDFPNFGREMEKTLMWNGGEGELSSEVKMSQILNQVLRFQLIRHENIQRLEYYEVRDCPAMETIVVESNGPRHRFTKLTKLEIWDCPKLSSCVFTQGMIQHMPNLEVLKVWNCEGIEEIVMREDVEETNLESNGPSTSTTNVTSVLLNLKELELSYLPNLSSICEDPRHRFTKLTSIYIRECPKLSSCVFTQGMIQHMPNLEVLEVWDCEGIEEIVMREDVEKTNHHHLQLIFFPKLISLRLAYCQNLVRIWKGASQPWPSIQEIYISHCPNLENLNLNAVDDKNSLAALKWISGTREWWEALKWEDENSKNRLQPLFEHVRN